MELGNYGSKAVINIPINIEKARRQQSAAKAAAKRARKRESRTVKEQSLNQATPVKEQVAEPVEVVAKPKSSISKGTEALSKALFPDGL